MAPRKSRSCSRVDESKVKGRREVSELIPTWKLILTTIVSWAHVYIVRNLYRAARARPVIRHLRISREKRYAAHFDLANKASLVVVSQGFFFRDLSINSPRNVRRNCVESQKFMSHNFLSSWIIRKKFPKVFYSDARATHAVYQYFISSFIKHAISCILKKKKMY